MLYYVILYYIILYYIILYYIILYYIIYDLNSLAEYAYKNNEKYTGKSGKKGKRTYLEITFKALP